MSSRTMDSQNPKDPCEQLGLEASHWLVRLRDDTRCDPKEPSSNAQQRDEEFLEWLSRSPEHISLFLDTREAYERLGEIDAKGKIKIDQLLERRNADVIRLFAQTAPAPQRNRARRAAIGIAAAAAILVVVSLMPWKVLGTHDYTTLVGEQRTFKLEDGSFIYLNTDSQVSVNFSAHQRHIELLRGEALFTVEHDPARPFVVSTSRADVRALGTQFNVRRRDESTDVTVVEGVVQVTALDDPSSNLVGLSEIPHPAASGQPSKKHSSPTLVTQEDPHPSASLPPSSRGGEEIRLSAGEEVLGAGEEARVISGKISKQASPHAADAVAWRERRLIFQDMPLSAAAAEFNRYNLAQIKVTGAIDLEITGVFDADRPKALVLYAKEQQSLVVENDGTNWVIRPRP